MANHRISLCTVSMDRTHHLRQTLARNILDNRGYKDLEYILLDYNSKDGCECFVRDQLTELIEDGTLVYYKTTDPTYFHHSHSRNMAFRLATGDLLCNIDADNFTGEAFAAYLDTVFSLDKDDFLAIRGYDETMNGYGFEDLDLINRLLMTGLKRKDIDNPDFLKVLKHGDWERICNKPEARLLDSILVRQIDHTSSQLIFLFRDGVLHTGTVVENICLRADDPFVELEPTLYPYEYSLREVDWKIGYWN